MANGFLHEDRALALAEPCGDAAVAEVMVVNSTLQPIQEDTV